MKTDFLALKLFVQTLSGVALLVACSLCKQWSCDRSSCPAHSFVKKENNFPLSLIQEEQDVSYWQKNGRFMLVNFLWEACPGTVWLSN